nr:hypothetical protein [Tanacetum cinerariifolium]
MNKQPIVGVSFTPQVMAIQGGRVQKYKPQGKAKGKGKCKGPQNSYPTKPKKPQPYKKECLAKDGQCHNCKEEGHWKKNCPVYLAELMKKKKTGGQNVISTSSGGAKKLKRSSLYLYVGNGVRAEVEAIGIFDLVLPNGLIIVLDNCHYAPSITRGVVSVSRLVDKGFTQCFTDFGLSVSMNNMLYFNAITVNAIRESNLDSTYLWHCGLEHINKKCIEKLHHDGLLKSTDNEPFDQYISCISGKMTKKPFSHKTEKGKDVLGFIHTVVCGLLRNVSKKGYPKETTGYYFYYLPENKIVVERYAYFLEKDFILQKESGRILELEDEYILTSKNTSEHPIEEESLSPIVSQEEDVILVRRSVRTHKAPDRLFLNVEIDPDRLCFNVEVKEHSLGDLNEPANNKAALSYLEFEKKKTDIDGKEHIYKARIVAKGCTQTYSVDYEETFSPVADIRAIRILIAIEAYYDYEIWKMDVKTAFLNGAVVWKSSKQNTTAQHATEAEYIAASEAANEAVWIMKFIDELGVVPSNDYPIKMNCDNSAAIIMAKESGIQKGAKHFKRKYHYVRECIETGEIDILKVHTDDNLADPFTKALAGPKLIRHARSMGLRPASSFM